MKVIVAALATCLIGLVSVMVATQDDRPGVEGSGLPGASGAREYGFITAEDLMTDNDAFYSKYLNPDPALKQISEWPIVKKVVDLGIDVLDAGTIADRLNRSLPADTQEGFAHIKEMVDSCANQLGITPPRLFIENDPHTNAYVTRLQEPHLLVITSSLYELYEDNPDELRFIIGHELGHLKCNHIRCHAISRALMHFIVGKGSTKKSWARAFIADKLVGKLMAWHREAEMSADRAGLLCVNGDLDLAQRALLRLMHGTKVEVDPNIAARELVEFEKEPFVKIVRKIRSFGNTHPFIPDRCLALREWVTTHQYYRITQRSAKTPTALQLVIEDIRITGLPEMDILGGVADPIISVSVGSRTIKSSRFDNDDSPSWSGLNWSTDYVPNSRVIIDVEDWDDANPSDFIGACILPVRTATAGSETMPLRPSVNDDSPASSLPQVTIRYKVVASK